MAAATGFSLHPSQFHAGYQRSYDIGPMGQLRLVWRVKSRLDDRVPVGEALNIVPLCPGDPPGDALEGSIIVELRHGRGAEFIVHRTREQISNALLNGVQVKNRQTNGLAVLLRAVLDIHGHIVHQALLHQRTQGGGMVSSFTA